MVVGEGPAAEPAVAQGDLPAVALVPPATFPPETVVKLEEESKTPKLAPFCFMLVPGQVGRSQVV